MFIRITLSLEAHGILAQLLMDYTIFIFLTVESNILFKPMNLLVVGECLGQFGIGPYLSPR